MMILGSTVIKNIIKCYSWLPNKDTFMKNNDI